MNPENLKYIEVPVHIPNLEGDGIAETKMVQVPVALDPQTGEEMLTEEAIELIETTKARYMGLLLPTEIKELRERLEFTQRQMSELLQAGQKSYTRWETGRARPSRMVNVLLRLLYAGKVSVSDLVAQRNQGTNWRDKVSSRPQWSRPITIHKPVAEKCQWVQCQPQEDNETLPVAA